MKIGLVATQFPTLTRAGGIAPPTERLARALAESFGNCSVVVTRTDAPLTKSVKSAYSAQGIDLLSVDRDPDIVYPWWLQRQWTVAHLLEKLDLDVVIAQEWMGLGALLPAKRSAQTRFISWLHGGTMYDVLGNNRSYSSFWENVDSEIERRQVESSDLVVSPSRMLLDWYRNAGWSIPEAKTQVIPYLVEVPNTLEVSHPRVRSRTAVAFIGQLSVRKGFDRFLNVLEQNRHLARDLQVMIFGKPTDFPEKLVEERLSNLGYDFVLEVGLTASDLWRKLAPFRAAVLCPARLDNSPNVVYEAAARGHVAFLWPGNGALELKDLFPNHVYEWRSLGEALHVIDSDLEPPPPLDIVNGEILDKWLKVVVPSGEADRGCAAPIRVGERPSRSALYPPVSVVIASRNRITYLSRALESLYQMRPELPLDVVVVDDFSDEPYLLRNLPSAPQHISIRVVRNEKQLGPGASRNIGAENAQADLLMFADDDNLLRPDHLLTLLKEYLSSDARVVVACHEVVRSNDPLPMAQKAQIDFVSVFAGSQLLPLGYLENVMGDTNMLVERSALKEVGGWQSAWPQALEDWEILLRFHGRHIQISSTLKATVVYRSNEDGVQANHVSGLAAQALDKSMAIAAQEQLHLLSLMRSLMIPADLNISTERAAIYVVSKFRQRFRQEPIRTLVLVSRLVSKRIFGARGPR